MDANTNSRETEGRGRGERVSSEQEVGEGTKWSIWGRREQREMEEGREEET